MADVIKTTFQLRRGEASVWKKNNPTLAKGEPGVELDTLKMKIGDGATPWNDLPYNAGATDWNELENRPFYEETVVTHSDVLTWDGNTEGLLQFVRPQQPRASAPSFEFYKVYDCAPQLSDLQKGGIVVVNSGGNTYRLEFGSENVIDMNTYYVIEPDGISSMVIVPENTNDNSTELIKGVYFGYDIGGDYFSSFFIDDYTFEIAKTETKTIDKKFLPEYLQFGDESTEEVVYFDDVVRDGMAFITYDNFIVPGKEYTVVYDGVTYDLVAVQEDRGPSISFESDTVGFWIFYDSGTGIETSDENEHTVRISRVVTTVNTINTKYLPDPLQIGSETTVLASWDGNTDNVEIFDASAAPTTYKISDDILTVEDILGSTVSFPTIGMEMPVEKAFMEPMPGMVVLGEQFVMLVSSEEIGVPLGVYATMPFSIYKETVTQIDEKYLPSGIVTQDNISEYLPSGIVTQDNISEYMPEEITSKLLPNTPNQSDTTVKYYPYYSVNNSRWYANANFIELRTKYGVTYIKPSDFISSDPVLSTSHNGGSGTRISPIDIKLYDPTVKKDTYLQLKRSAITFKANNSTHTVSINWDDTDGSLRFNHTLPTGISSGQTSLKNIAAPVDTYDAVNKEYVDNKHSDTELYLTSSTEGSTKKFKITVDDSGTISATEVSEPK